MSGAILLAPMRLEALALRRGARDATIERIGMGPARAIAAYQSLSSRALNRPIVVAGVAGALVEGLAVGDIVVANALAPLGEGDVVSLDGADALAQEIAKTGRNVRVGPIVSSPSIVKGAEARKEAGACGALAVDMESLWCAPLARTVPYYVVRVILDVPGQDVISFATFRNATRAFRVLGDVARAITQVFSPVSSSSLSKVGDS